jgi:hypothetical protein
VGGLVRKDGGKRPEGTVEAGEKERAEGKKGEKAGRKTDENGSGRVKTDFFPDVKKVVKRNSPARDIFAHSGLELDGFQTLCFLYGNACVRCGSGFEHCYHLSPDHVDGNWRNRRIKNLQPLDRACNTSKATKAADFRPDKGRRLDDFETWVEFYKRLKGANIYRLGLLGLDNGAGQMTTEFFPDFKKVAKSERKDRDLFEHYGLEIDEYETFCFLYGNACVRCGVIFEHCYLLSVDHINGDWRGRDIKGFQPLCMLCNQAKGTRGIDFRPDKGRCLDEFQTWVDYYKRLKQQNAYKVGFFEPREGENGLASGNGFKPGLRYTTYFFDNDDNGVWDGKGEQLGFFGDNGTD